MNIGFDAYYLYSSENTGIGNHTINLLIELSKLDKKNKYFLYTPDIKNIKTAGTLLKNPNFNIIKVNNFLKKSRRLWLQHLSLIKQIKKNEVDLFIGSGEYLPALLPKSIKTSVIIYDVVFKVYPDTVSLENKIFYNTLFRYCIKKSDYFFTISENSKKDIIKYLNPGNKEIFVIPCGIDIKKYSPGTKNKKKDYILFVGTIQPRKNLINLLKAFSSIHDKIEEDIVIVGASGWKNSDIASFIESLPGKVKERLDFKGFIDDNTLIELYREARLFAAPSLHEGFGLIILEAMATGTPVLTSPTAAIPEFFTGAAEFADPLSPDDIASSMIKLLKNKRRQTELVKKGLERSKKYTLKKMGENYLQILNDIENDIC